MTISMTFIEAVKSGDIDRVKGFIGSGEDVNQRGREEVTPLMIAVARSDIAMARLLIEAGADMEIRDRLGDNAFIFAGLSGSEEVFDVLVESGFKPTQKDLRGALDQAIKQDAPHIVKYLIEHGADVKRKNAHNRGAIAESIADDADRCFSYFLESGIGWEEEEQKQLVEDLIERSEEPRKWRSIQERAKLGGRNWGRSADVDDESLGI